MQLHNFLFSDLYFDKDLEVKNLNETEKTIIKIILMYAEGICLNYREMQLFKNGNTRTLIAYLYILNKAFLLNIDLELDKEISNTTMLLNLNKLVNPNRLTKTK